MARQPLNSYEIKLRYREVYDSFFPESFVVSSAALGFYWCGDIVS